MGKKINHAVVLIIHLMDIDKIIALQRKNKETFGFIGGKLDAGESVQDCIVREVYEEISLKIDIKQVIYLTCFNTENYLVHYFSYKIENSSDLLSKLKSEDNRPLKFMETHEYISVSEYPDIDKIALEKHILAIQPTYAAVCIIFDVNGNLISVKRTYNDTFGLVGGKVDEGETPLIAVHREIQEEIGINLDIDTLMFATEIFVKDKKVAYYYTKLDKEYDFVVETEIQFTSVEDYLESSNYAIYDKKVINLSLFYLSAIDK